MPKRKPIPPGLRNVPNVGPATAEDLVRLGYDRLARLRGADPKKLYGRLCRMDRRKHDVCVLDTLEAVVHQADGGRPKPWWFYSRRRLRQGRK